MLPTLKRAKLQSTYFVDAANGNDGYTGRSPSAAWQTISKVNGFTFSSGDRILFKRGQTWTEKLTIPASNLCFGNYGSGDLPVITGSAARDHCIYSTGKNNIIVDGIKATNSTWEAIDLESGTNITVRNCKTDDTTNIGILLATCTNIDISNNTVTNSDGNGISANACTNGHVRHNDVSYCGQVTDDRSCISIYDNCSNIHVHHNICHDSTNAGGVGIRGIIIDTCGNNTIYVYNNKCYSCNGSGIMAYLSNSWLVYNNLCYENPAPGGMWNAGIKVHTCTGGNIYHNTTYNNRGAGIWTYLSSNIVIKNNVCWQNSSGNCIAIDTNGATHTEDYNCVYGTTNEWSYQSTDYSDKTAYNGATGQGAHDVEDNPDCVGAYDYHLQSVSPCINAGVTGIPVADDYDSVIRGSSVDIGAYEYTS